MRIVQVCPIYYPSLTAGGVTRVVQEVSEGLARRGHDVAVVTTDFLFDEGQPTGHRVSKMPPRHNHVDVYYLRNLHPRIFPLLGMVLAPSTHSVAKRLSREADVLHIHEIRGHQTIAALRAASSTGCPIVVSPHGALPQSTGRRLPKRLFDMIFMRSILRRADAIVALNDIEQAMLLSLGVPASKIALIPNGIRPPSSLPTPVLERFRTKHQLTRNDLVVAFVGRLHARKRLDVAIEAFARVSSQFPNATMLIAGADAGHREELEALIAKRGMGLRIRFLGPISEDDRRSLLGVADLFVLTSIGEGQPVAVLEAAAAGLPLLLTTGTNLAEVAQVRAGLVVGQKVAEVAQGFQALLSNAEMRQQMGKSARSWALGAYGFDRQLDSLERLYAQLADRRHGEVRRGKDFR